MSSFPPQMIVGIVSYHDHKNLILQGNFKENFQNGNEIKSRKEETFKAQGDSLVKKKFRNPDDQFRLPFR